MIRQRKEFFDRTKSLNPVPEAWQTEYSLLGNGYREGYPDGYKLSEMESALSLARVIITDLNVTNTTGWQWWTTFERGKHGGEARFCLIEAHTKEDNSDGVYYLNKLFYTFGNFSHFIRPGMTRLGITRSDKITAFQETSGIMFSAYSNDDEDQFVLVAVNVTGQAKEVNLVLKNSSGKTLKNQSVYLTDEYSNLAIQDIDWLPEKIIVPAHSVITYTAGLDVKTAVKHALEESGFEAWFDALKNKIVATVYHHVPVQNMKLYSISGDLLQIIQLKTAQEQVFFPALHLPEGIYLVSVKGNNFRKTKKVIVTKQ